MIDAFNVAAARPWAITSDGLETVLAVLDRMGDPEALAAKLGRPLDNTRSVDNRDGVAVVPINGPIARYSNLFADISGATSTQVLATDFQAALDDPSVHAIVLNIDSPGGEVSGIDELSQRIYDARGTKPIVAYIGGQGASAAYWIGSAADSMVADRAAIVGSIGIVMSHMDTSAKDEKAGVRRHEIVSSVSPDKRIDPGTEAGRSKVQKIVDDLAGVFTSTVARNRGTDADTVASNYGRGGVLVGQSAVDAGMVDSLGSLEGVIASLAKPTTTLWRTSKMANTASKTGSVTVTSQADYLTALDAGYEPRNINFAMPDVEALKREAHSAGVSEGKASATDDAKAEAARLERERIAAIHSISAKGFENEIKEAVEKGHSAEATAFKIMRIAAERGVTLGAIASDATRAAHAGKTGEDAAPASWDKAVAKLSKGAK